MLAYQSACRAEQKFEFGTSSDLPLALANFDARVRTIRAACDADEVICAFSCPSRVYHRHKLWAGYKAGRGEKPSALSAVREHCLENYETKTKPSLEADDVLAILATWPSFTRGKRVIIVTTDKDLNQIPGLHLNPDKLDRGIYTVTPEEGDRFHLYQTLVGDSCDGYPGCKGIGPLKANRALANAQAEYLDKKENAPSLVRGETLVSYLWSAAVVRTFIKKGLTEEDALLQARLARILRAEDWDFKKKEPRLWQPTAGK